MEAVLRLSFSLLAEAEVAQGEVKLEGVAALGVAGRHVVAPPGKRDLHAIVLVGRADASAQRLETIGYQRRVFILVGQVEHARAEQRPVLGERDPARQPQLLAVAQVFGRQGAWGISWSKLMSRSSRR